MYNNIVADANIKAFFDFAEANKFALVKVHKSGKRPVGDDWQTKHSEDRTEWERWQAEGFNLGVHAGASRLVTFDLDSKHGGIAAVRARFDSWCLLKGMAPLPNHVETPSMGHHIYMRVPDGVDPMALATNLSGKIGKGVDVLIGNRQSVAPGSYFDGTGEGKPSGTYVFKDEPVYDAPEAVLEFCTPKPRAKAGLGTGEFDYTDMEARCAFLAKHDEYLADEFNWVKAVWALRLAFGDRGWPLAEIVSYRDHKNRLHSVWERDSDTEYPSTCATLIDESNRAGYREWKREHMFDGVAQLVKVPSGDVPTAPGQAQQFISTDYPVPGGANVTAAEPREYEEPVGGLMQKLGDRLKDFVLPDYLWDGILMKRFCYSMTAQTGTGKTALALLIAAHVATGQSLCNLDIEKGQVIYMAGENPIDVDMRFLGLCKVMGLDPDALEIAILPFAGPLSKYADAIRSECETRDIKPALIIVDTAAAYFDGKEGNSNEEQGDYARSLRALTTLPGQPCILVLAHPTKGAKDINEMVPRGGGAFIAEMDGNIGVARGDGGLIGAQAIGKFRGPEFTPLNFALHSIKDVPALYDKKKSKFRPTVVAQPVSEAGAATVAIASERSDIRLLRDIDDHPRDTHRERAQRLGCSHTTVGRRIEKLAARKLVDDSGLIERLTAKGQRELNDLESLHQDAPSNPRFPVPTGS